MSGPTEMMINLDPWYATGGAYKVRLIQGTLIEGEISSAPGSIGALTQPRYK